MLTSKWIKIRISNKIYFLFRWTFYREQTGPKIASITYRPFVNEGVYEFESNQFVKFQFSRLSSSFNYSIVAFNEKVRANEKKKFFIFIFSLR